MYAKKEDIFHLNEVLVNARISIYAVTKDKLFLSYR